MPKQTKRPAASAIGVQIVPTDSLHPNPHNPRMLFDRQPLKVLRQSIERVGILVPLTVYLEARRKRLVILDGQRRWICAQEIGLPKVPVNEVAEPSLVQNIVTMFQIHKLRADWELMPTALKVGLLMKEVNDRNNARLAELTGLDEAQIVRCKKLISYDSEFQDLMLDPDPDKRVKADFFIELYAVIHDREVSQFEWFSKNKFIRRMLEKYLQAPRTIKSVTDFRLVKQHIANARRVGAVVEFSRRLREFFEVHETPISHLEIQEANIHAGATAMVKKISSLESSMVDLDAEQFYGEEALWDSIISLIKVLEKKLLEANKHR
jgi:ParB family transcriptional regulator, chromosome partitioning protein